jgi:hypothetical protein
MMSGLGNLEACFLSRIKAFFIEHRGYDDLRRAAEGGNNAAAYLYTILLYREWRCRYRRHHEGVHEAGCGRRQYDVEMAEQRGVSAYAREGCACTTLLDLVHLW